MSEPLQKYQLRLTRGIDGYWVVTGYWEVPKYSHSPNGERVWELDGAPRMFPTRKEALEFCLTQTGIPN